MKGLIVLCVFASSALVTGLPASLSSLASSIPSMTGSFPTLPPGIPTLSALSAGIPTLPTLPAGMPTLPTLPAGIPTLPTLPAGIPTLPTLPAGIPTLPTLPAGIPTLPALPTGIPTLPSLPTGQLSYMQIFSLVSGFYNNPINKLIPLPPITEMISVALKINSAVNSVSEANTAIQNMMKKTAENIIYSLGPTTTKAPSILSGLFGRQFYPKPTEDQTVWLPGNVITFPLPTSTTPSRDDSIG